MSEEEYQVDGDSVKGVKRGAGKSGGIDVPEWVKKLEEFKVPTVAEDEFLNGCKVSKPLIHWLHVCMCPCTSMKYNKYEYKGVLMICPLCLFL